jgi:hypothetical protein
MRFRLGNVNIWREKPGIVSTGPTWCASYGGTMEHPSPCYLHIHDTFWGLLIELLFDHHNDRHLAGY